MYPTLMHGEHAAARQRQLIAEAAGLRFVRVTRETRRARRDERRAARTPHARRGTLLPAVRSAHS